MKIETTTDMEWRDADEFPPPEGKVMWVLSKYGVATKDKFVKGFHIAWLPLPKIPTTLRSKMSGCKYGRE